MEERNELFKKWYPRVKEKKIPMSAFTDEYLREDRARAPNTEKMYI